MRLSYLMTAVLMLGTATVAETLTATAAASHTLTGVAEASMHSEANGIRIWTRLMDLGGQEGFSGLALTLFVPSDNAFMTLPPADLSKLLAPDQRALRRAYLARAATDARISPQEIAGRRVSITTLDGRLLIIDATGGELMVGAAEAIDVQTLPNGLVMFVLDQPSTD